MPAPSRDPRPTRRPDKSAACELCERTQPLEFHHLIPRKLHRRRAFLKRYDKDHMRHLGLWLCRPCHRMLHRTFGEHELGSDLSSREAIVAQPQVQRFLGWVKKQR